MILRFFSAFYGGMKSLSSGFYLTWGVNYARWGQPAKALYYMNRAAKLNNKSSNVFYHRALLLIAMGQPEAALVDFDAAIGANPKHMESYLNRSVLLAMTGRADEVQSDVDNAVALGADRVSLEARIAEFQE